MPLATLLTTSPQYTAVDVLDSWAGSSYHAATVRLERRFSSGFSALLSYTFSKLLDDNLGNGGNGFTDSGSNSVQNWENRRAEKGVSTTFQPHRFTAAASYLLPFGKSGNRLYRAVVGGWQANVIASLMSGNVISVTANAPTYGGDRPNIAGDPSLDNPTVDRWLNRDAFTNIAAYTLGNGPRNLPRTLSQALINFDTSSSRRSRSASATSSSSAPKPSTSPTKPPWATPTRTSTRIPSEPSPASARTRGPANCNSRCA